MRRSIAALLGLLIAFLTVGAQPTGLRKTFLLVKNCKVGESLCNTQELVSYGFENGELVSKKVILSTEEVRFDLGSNLVLQNRYVITNWADVIDVANSKLLHKSDGEFVGVEGNRIFIKVNRADQHGVFVFDLGTNKYSRLPSPNVWELEGIVSPDHTKAARFELVRERDKSPGRVIVVEQVGKKPISLKADLGAECGKGCDDRFHVPFIWIFDDRILTQRSNGNLIALGMDGRVDSLFKLKCDQPYDYYPRFYSIDGRRIAYACGKSKYWLDLDAKTFSQRRFDSGYGFEHVSAEWFWKELYFEDSKIGRVWGSPPHTTNDFVALEYAEEGVNLGSPKGVKVWNRIKNDWITIEIPWSASIIGWIND